MTCNQEKVKAKLIIRGFECSPAEITSILGISPQKTNQVFALLAQSLLL